MHFELWGAPAETVITYNSALFASIYTYFGLWDPY